MKKKQNSKKHLEKFSKNIKILKILQDSVSTRYFLFVDSVSTRYFLFIVTVSTQYFLFIDTVSMNRHLQKFLHN